MTMRSSSRLALTAALAAGLAVTAQAQPAFRVKDVHRGTADAFPRGFTLGNGTAFFEAMRPTGVLSLFATDGTTAGTRPLCDLPLGSTEAAFLGGRLYFGNGDIFTGERLWFSDGTECGPILNTPASSNLVVAGGRLFFTAFTIATGTEVWTSDGTTAGTRLLKDLAPGGTSSQPFRLTEAGGLLFFTASTPATGWELWRSDGTEAGTVVVADLEPGPGGSFPDDLIALGSTLLFTRPGPPFMSRRALWRTDGTPGGTIPLGAATDFPASMARVGGVVFFNGIDDEHGTEVWKTDGTPAGTVRVADTNPGPASGDPGSFVDVGGQAYFINGEPGTGRELWRSDGTAAGTALVRDVRPGALDGGVSRLTDVAGSLFFVADEGTGAEVWKSDGTSLGTAVVTDINPGSSAHPLALFALGGTLLFSGTDGLRGQELWRSDGTLGGTTLLQDLNPAPGRARIQDLTDLDGKLLFSADDGAHGRELWTSDGSEAGTVLVKDVNAGLRGAIGSLASPGARLGPTLVLAAQDNDHGDELWKTDGTAAGTRLVRDILPGLPPSAPATFLATGSAVFFHASGATFRELWKTDGTSTGTVRLRASGILPGDMVAAGGQVLFHGSDDAHGQELWVTDGTAAGSHLLKDITPGVLGTSVASPTVVGGQVLFGVLNGARSVELWRSDGTEAGTVRVKELDPGRRSYREPVVAGGRLFFVVCHSQAFCGLWRSDGTEAGTVKLLAIKDNRRFYLTPLGADVLFAADDGVSFPQLWRSDGTPGGTRLVMDVDIGERPYFPVLLAAAGGSVVFCANGVIFWSDGTAEGTRPVRDGDVPCPDTDAFGSRFKPSGPFVYYGQDEGPEGGDALWAIRTSALTGLRAGDCTVREGDSGTNTCDFTLSLSAPLPDPATVGYATANGTALAGTDYVAASGSVTFPPGSIAQTVSVLVSGDTTAEANKSFFLALSGASGAVMVDRQGVGTILDDEAAKFFALTPCRVADTRNAAGVSGGPALTGNRTRSFPAAGLCGIPATAKAVAINVTVVNPEAGGNLRIYPAGAAVPTASVINFAAGRTRANNAVVSLGASGSMTVQYDVAPGTTAATHFLFDVSGYFQ